VTVEAFYDRLAPFYHLVFPVWEASIQRQAAALDGIIREHWGGGRLSILDVACGVGIQALGLADLRHAVTASDVSPAAVERAEQEAKQRSLRIAFSVADMRAASTHHRRESAPPAFRFDRRSDRLAKQRLAGSNDSAKQRTRLKT
jgi:2-polyprenyl-3-methyl-5-hydroxy-6-metoxy-1,4-benzoquinol methylase